MIPIDIFHVPRGFSFDGYESRQIDTDSGATMLRYPKLTPASVASLCDTVRGHRNSYLADRPVSSIIDSIARAMERWADPQYPERRIAQSLIPQITGYDPNMMRIELKRFLRMFRRRELLRFVDNELDCPQMLDEYRPNKAGGYTRYYGPGLSFHVFSSNVPGIPVWSMTMSLLVKSAVFGKSSFDEPLMPALFARSLAQVDPDLADAIAVVPWKGGDAPLEDAAIDKADAVIAYGSSRTTETLHARVIGGKPFLEYGARIGFSLIGREALRIDRHVDTVHRMSIDVATYDQQSCLAPQTIFIEHGGAIQPFQAAELLAHELDSQQRKYPRAILSDAESLSIQRARSAMQMKALLADGGDGSERPFAVCPAASTDWTVLYLPNVDMLDSLSSPLNRTVNVVAVDRLEDALAAVQPYRRWLQTCGIAVESDRLFPLAQLAGRYGIDRICPIGEMNRAKSGWHHDGGFNLLSLVHAVDLERGIDTFADTFDADFE